MKKYRIQKVGCSYYVQRYGIVNLDGMLDYDWKDCISFDDEKKAEEYLKKVSA